MELSFTQGNGSGSPLWKVFVTCCIRRRSAQHQGGLQLLQLRFSRRCLWSSKLELAFPNFRMEFEFVYDPGLKIGRKEEDEEEMGSDAPQAWTKVSYTSIQVACGSLS